MRYLGVKILLPQDLFATANNDLIGEGSFAQVRFKYVAVSQLAGTLLLLADPLFRASHKVA